MEENARLNGLHYAILHNRKTAGTALKEIIDQQKQRTPEMKVACFSHSMTFPRLINASSEVQAIFFVRDPLSRFISGFYSRLRQGQPRYHFPWTRGEAKAFARFLTPNQLAEALSHDKAKKRRAAIAAMQSIGHVRHTFLDFLGSLTFLKKHASRIAYIGHQSEFDTDLLQLRRLLTIHDDILAPSDDVKAHRNPSGLDKYLSPNARLNLEQWYDNDIAIYQWCLKYRQSLIHTP